MANVGRPRKDAVKAEEVVKVTPPLNDSSKEARAVEEKAILDVMDWDKKRKDVLLLNSEELVKHIESLNVIIGDLTKDYESKKRILDGVNGSIAGAQSELYNLRSNFAKQNSDLMAEITKQQKEVEKADETLQKLIQENREAKKANEIETSKLAEHRQLCNSQLYEMQKALDQNNAEWNKREADILRREEELKAEKLAFADERLQLKPEIDEITSTRNENKLLLQKIEMDRLDIENMRKASLAEKERITQEKLVSDVRIKQLEDKLANEDARLRKWEQDIKDYDLEVRAKSAQADKIIKRAQLEKELEKK